ncbi:hypothetical protein [Ruminiclostridium josui]|uniref:hypothetical protein n=1 Tax=Ruminiclostridium josui TaxID=1499 RepID=UPI000AB38004|nr:hypothetical protein [Ruminiclostridium josui]
MVKTCIYLRKSREDERMEKELGKGETLSKHREDLLNFAKKKDLFIAKFMKNLLQEKVFFTDLPCLNF